MEDRNRICESLYRDAVLLEFLTEGQFVHDTSAYYADRKYFRLLYPTGSGKLFGYFVNWAYDAVCEPFSKINNSMGSFTWKLNPDGVNDKTPAEEVNASSTIYDLSIAQEGYNANNYTTDWVPTENVAI